MQQISFDTKKPEKKKLTSADIQKILFVDYKRVTILGVIAICMLMVLGTMSSKFKESEAFAKQQYAKYQNALASANATQDTTKKTNVVIIPSETAVDANKINSDIEQANAYMKNWFSWKNGDEYDASRADVIATFGADSPMATLFVENARADGTSYVDVFGINMEMAAVKTYPIEINKDSDNKYLSVMTINTRRDGYITKYNLAMTYTFNTEGRITNATVDFLKQ